MAGCGADDADDSKSGSDKTNSTGSSAKKTTDETIKLTLWGAEGDQDFLKGVVSKFEAAYPDQKFDIQIGVESESTAKDTILTDIEAAADVFSFASDQLPDLVKAGALLNLDEYGEALSMANKTLDDVKNANVEDSVAAASVDGSMYAFPTTGGNSYFLYYDSSVISEEDAASWDTLLAAAAKAKKKVGMTLNSGWYLASFFYGSGFTTGLNADGTTAMDWNGKSADGYTGVDVTKGILNITSNSSFMAMADRKISDLIASGDLCAAVSGTWDAGNARKVWGKGYSAIKLPTFTVGNDQVQMKPAYGYKFEGVNAYSKNAGWAVLLAEFIGNEETQIEHFKQAVQVPTNKKALEDEAITKDIAATAVASEAEFGVIQMVGGKYWDPAATFGEILAKGKLKANDDKGIQKALDDLVAGVTAKVE
ncbi:MAG: extracellular solute-binding protein [Lachnospiraceae bacterium]|nr:extracellular solute-binding protein [Lachnospiraceae bacterium]